MVIIVCTMCKSIKQPRNEKRIKKKRKNADYNHNKIIIVEQSNRTYFDVSPWPAVLCTYVWQTLSRNIWSLLVLCYCQRWVDILHFVFAWTCSRLLAAESKNYKHKVNGNRKLSENRAHNCHLFISHPTLCVVTCLTRNPDSILSLWSGSLPLSSN